MTLREKPLQLRLPKEEPSIEAAEALCPHLLPHPFVPATGCEACWGTTELEQIRGPLPKHRPPGKAWLNLTLSRGSNGIEVKVLEDYVRGGLQTADQQMLAWGRVGHRGKLRPRCCRDVTGWLECSSAYRWPVFISCAFHWEADRVPRRCPYTPPQPPGPPAWIWVVRWESRL